MAKYRCTMCNYVYNEAKEKVKFNDLPKQWVCPVCGAPKSAFVLLTGKAEEVKNTKTSDFTLKLITEYKAIF